MGQRHVSRAEPVELAKYGEVIPGLVAALDTGQLGHYVCDFPNGTILRHPRVIALPHLGACTREAEENCAVMVVEQLRDFLEHGNIRNAVNFPDTRMGRGSAWLGRTAAHPRYFASNGTCPPSSSARVRWYSNGSRMSHAA